MQDDATLPAADGAPRASAVVIDKRYDLKSVIGRGGMGEVRLARDIRIDRDVAVKLMRVSTTDKEILARFFREAHVQGRLDHPAVVPVHDLGIDHEGQPYFVMKRLTGITLAEALQDPKWTQKELLARFADICLAIEFAHARGIVHRDLKPANIMLGDYGEAYVIDWGLARVTDDNKPLVIPTLSGEDGHTEAGALLGTPGYMSPEQARGEEVDASTDVFALGCVLFEIVAGQPALPRGLAAIDPTLTTEEHRPSTRAVDVPLELDDLAAHATANKRTSRPTARELGERVQAYLVGDRDTARRQQLAKEHVERAQAALARGGDDGRAIAMREAGRAFVLDSTNKDAQDIIARLTLSTPKPLPAAAIEAANLSRARVRRRVLGWGAASYAFIALGLCSLFMFPVRHMWPLVSSIGVLVAISASLGWMSMRLMPMRSLWYLWILALNTLVLITTSYIFGPLLIVPVFLCGSLAVYLNTPIGFHPSMVVVTHVAAMVIPLATELTGITPRTFSMEHGLHLQPYAVDLPTSGLVMVMIVAMILQFANTTITALSQRRGQEVALDRIHAQSWHLRQLLSVSEDDEPS